MHQAQRDHQRQIQVQRAATFHQGNQGRDCHRHGNAPHARHIAPVDTGAQPAGQHHAQDLADRAYHQRPYRVATRETQLDRIRHHEDRDDVVQRHFAQLVAYRQKQRLPVFAHQLQRRYGHCLLALLHLDELGCFRYGRTDVVAADDQHHAGQERQTPAPFQKAAFRQLRHQGERRRRQHQAQWHTGKRQRAKDAFPFGRRVLDGHQYCPTELAAERHALHHAQQHQQDWRPGADRGVAGHQADAYGGQAHQDKA
ncbi:hypothetical protein D3C72_1470380 [compost metagenome]